MAESAQLDPAEPAQLDTAESFFGNDTNAFSFSAHLRLNPHQSFEFASVLKLYVYLFYIRGQK